MLLVQLPADMDTALVVNNVADLIGQARGCCVMICGDKRRNVLWALVAYAQA